MGGPPLKLFETRDELLASIVQAGMHVAELGVFAGDFSKFLSSLPMAKLYLVDLFEGHVFSGDQDGNSGRILDLTRVLPELEHYFAADQRVQLVRGTSDSFLGGLPDRSLDIVYIDADHSYEAVSRDLQLAVCKVRPGGFVCGHDYEMNMSKARTCYDFGVRRAVDEFCASHGLEICAKGMDGCVSFCIQLPGPYSSAQHFVDSPPRALLRPAVYSGPPGP